MPATVTRRAFLKLTALAASAAAFARLLPGRAVAAVRACLPVLGTEVPMAVPFAVGDDCAPPPTVTATDTATPTSTATVTANATLLPTSTPTASATSTATLSPTATPTPWLAWLPLVLRQAGKRRTP